MKKGVDNHNKKPYNKGTNKRGENKMERFGFELYVADEEAGRTGKFEGFGNRAKEIIEEKERKEELKLEKKALRENKTIEQVKKEEEEKRIAKNNKAKYKRYLKEIEELKEELEYKTKWIEKYKKTLDTTETK